MAVDLPAKIIMDFTNTKDRSDINPTHQPAGDYRGVIKDVKHTISQTENKTPQLVYVVQDVDRPSATYRYNCPLTENSAWKIRNLLIAAGVQVPKKKANIAGPAARILGKEIGISLDDDEYNGKMRSQITGVFPADQLGDDADDDEPVATKKRGKAATNGKAATKKATADDEDEDEDEEDLDELDIDDL